MIEIIDGTAYENGKPIILHIIDLKPLEGYRLLATFQDGTIRMYDAGGLLDFPAFRPLANPEKFAKVTLDHGIPTWRDENLDLAPESVYANGAPWMDKGVFA